MKKHIITHFKDIDPTTTNNVAAGYNIGQEWINTTSGDKFYYKSGTTTALWVKRAEAAAASQSISGTYFVNDNIGNDATGIIGDKTKPYKTIAGVFAALPALLYSETYRLLFTYDASYVCPIIPQRNLIFEGGIQNASGDSGVLIDFTNTVATNVGNCLTSDTNRNNTITFSNVNLVSASTANNAKFVGVSTDIICDKATISFVSSSPLGLFQVQSVNGYIEKIFLQPNETIFGTLDDSVPSIIYISELFATTPVGPRWLITGGTGTSGKNIVITIRLFTGTNQIYLENNCKNVVFNIGDLNMTTTAAILYLTNNSRGVNIFNFMYTELIAGAPKIDIGDSHALITGSMNPTNPSIALTSRINSSGCVIIFKDFVGRLGTIELQVSSFKLYFINTHINCNGPLIKTNAGFPPDANSVVFRGGNTFYYESSPVALIDATAIPITIQKIGFSAITTNATITGTEGIGWANVTINYIGENPELITNKQNNMTADGTGIKYPTVDTINQFGNNILKVTAGTGFIDNNDLFRIVLTNSTTITITASSPGAFIRDILFGVPTVPAAAIVNVPNTTLLANNAIFNDLTTDGRYIRYLGYNYLTGLIVSLPTPYLFISNVVQLAYVQLLRAGGVNSFTVLQIEPDISSSHLYELVMIPNQTTVKIFPNANTTVRNTIGQIKAHGINFGGSNPHTKNFSVSATTSFTRIDPSYTSTTIGFTPTTTVLTNNYWNGTALVSLANQNNNATIQRWFLTLDGRMFLQVGETQYASKAAAEKALGSVVFTDIFPPDITIEICRMIAIGNTTNLANTDQAQFYYTSSGGGSSSGGTGSGPATIILTPVAGIINSSDLDSAGYGQDGRNVAIDNGAVATSLIINSTVTSTYMRLSVGGATGPTVTPGVITFSVAAPITALVQVDNTATFDGVAGSSASVVVIGTVAYVRISNA